MTREELRDYVEEQRSLDMIPYHVYSTLIDGIDTLGQGPKIGHWIINKEEDTICCSCCNDKQKIGKDEVELLDTAFTRFRFCKYCGSNNSRRWKLEI